MVSVVISQNIYITGILAMPPSAVDKYSQFKHFIVDTKINYKKKDHNHTFLKQKLMLNLNKTCVSAFLSKRYPLSKDLFKILANIKTNK